LLYGDHVGWRFDNAYYGGSPISITANFTQLGFAQVSAGFAVTDLLYRFAENPREVATTFPIPL
jgi:hypothetical protein